MVKFCIVPIPGHVLPPRTNSKLVPQKSDHAPDAMDSLGPLDRAAERFTDRIGQFVSSHPRSLASAVTLALAGFGATAFGIAPLAPDPADLPRRLVTEILPAPALDEQLEALAGRGLDLYRSEVTRSGDSAAGLLQRLGVEDAAAAAFLRKDAIARTLFEGRAGKMVRVRVDASGALDELVARYAASGNLAKTHFTRLSVRREGGSLRARSETVAYGAQQRLGSGTIQSSLFAATDESGIPDAIAIQMAEIFSANIDFHRELRKGDRFTVVYETLTADGEPVSWNAGVGRVLAAEFVNKGRAHSAVWFKDEVQGKGGYFDFEGKSRTLAYLTSPLEFSRTTSGFAMRLHPILKQWRRHNGVDYAAPRGTPVRSVGDGVVEFSGWQNGYGNVVQVKHSNDKATLYAHLTRTYVKVGQRVEQGENVGTVGSTGWATGPHLHFEFKVGGVQVDPATMVQTAEAVTLSPQSQARFADVALALREPLDLAATVDRSGTFAE